jgi:hypothetical protein
MRLNLLVGFRDLHSIDIADTASVISGGKDIQAEI